MAFVDHHRVPVPRAQRGDQIATGKAGHRREQMLERGRLRAADQQLAELRIAQHFAIAAQRLAQDFLAMGHEQKRRLAAQPCA